MRALHLIYALKDVGSQIIFVRTKKGPYGAEGLAAALSKDEGGGGPGFAADYLHGDVEPGDGRHQRKGKVQAFKDGETNVLVSTDLLARGFNVPTVNLVVNFELPIQHFGPRGE